MREMGDISGESELSGLLLPALRLTNSALIFNIFFLQVEFQGSTRWKYSLDLALLGMNDLQIYLISSAKHSLFYYTKFVNYLTDWYCIVCFPYNRSFIGFEVLREVLFATCFQAAFLPSLFFDPEVGGNIFLINVSRLSTEYVALYLRR